MDNQSALAILSALQKEDPFLKAARECMELARRAVAEARAANVAAKKES